MSPRGQKGFTLVELAIVLVIIGLILGMAFKGKDLIDGAKVKNAQAQYNKVLAAFNTFYERYGFYPGDGCTNPNATTVAPGANGCVAAGVTPVRDGVLANANETSAAMSLLLATNMLTTSDIQSVFGQRWSISIAGAAAGGFAANTNYLTLTNAAGAVQATADMRYVCQLDRLIDDGVQNTGVVRSGTGYNNNTDCWTAFAGTRGTIGMRLLP